MRSPPARRRASFLFVLLLGGCTSVATPDERAGLAPRPAAEVPAAGAPATPEVSHTTVAPAAPEAPAPPARSEAEVTARRADYPWFLAERYEALVDRIPPPPGASRVKVAPGSYADWLRHLPMRAVSEPVRAHDGRTVLPVGHRALAAVVDLDLVPGDLQQCADTIIRLRAEYLHRQGREADIVFQYTSGYRSAWSAWARGVRPQVRGDAVTPAATGRPDGSRPSFLRYLRDVFMYAGTYSVRREALAVDDPAAVAIGDFFVLSGSPGHAVIVLDLARDAAGRQYALIGQGFMPAQDLHVLRGPDGGPWFALDPAAEGVETPLWPTFPWSALRRYR